MKKHLIRTYLRRELNPDGIRHGRFVFFTPEQVAQELERRDDLNRKRLDKFRYPHLSHS